MCHRSIVGALDGRAVGSAVGSGRVGDASVERVNGVVNGALSMDGWRAIFSSRPTFGVRISHGDERRDQGVDVIALKH